MSRRHTRRICRLSAQVKFENCSTRSASSRNKSKQVSPFLGPRRATSGRSSPGLENPPVHKLQPVFPGNSPPHPLQTNQQNSSVFNSRPKKFQTKLLDLWMFWNFLRVCTSLIFKFITKQTLKKFQSLQKNAPETDQKVVNCGFKFFQVVSVEFCACASFLVRVHVCAVALENQYQTVLISWPEICH